MDLEEAEGEVSRDPPAPLLRVAPLPQNLPGFGTYGKPCFAPCPIGPGLSICLCPGSLCGAKGVLGPADDDDDDGDDNYYNRTNHRMVWVGRDLIDHLVPSPLPWAGTLIIIVMILVDLEQVKEAFPELREILRRTRLCCQ